MDTLEQALGIRLGNYGYSPFSLGGIKAWREVQVYGFNVSKWDQPEILFAYTLNGERIYDKVSKATFKADFRPVVAEINSIQRSEVQVA